MGSVSIRFRLGFAFTGFIAACGGAGGGGSGAVADAATGGDAAAGGSGGSGGSSGSSGGGTGGSAGTGTGSCQGHCGSSSPVPGSNPQCYCDGYCTQNNDCCGDKTQVCGG